MLTLLFLSRKVYYAFDSVLARTATRHFIQPVDSIIDRKKCKHPAAKIEIAASIARMSIFFGNVRRGNADLLFEPSAAVRQARRQIVKRCKLASPKNARYYLT
jgi:hypothetical protein